MVIFQRSILSMNTMSRIIVIILARKRHSFDRERAIRASHIER